MLICIMLLMLNLTMTSVYSQFCYSRQPVTRVFTLANYVYIGNETSFYRYNIKKNYVEYDTYNIEILFGTNSFSSLLSVIHFDFDPCVSNRPKEFCQNASKAKNLVLAFGRMMSNAEQVGYIAYRWQNRIPLPKVKDGDMPWKIPTYGAIFGYFWVNYGQWQWHYTGFTFASHGLLNTLYASVYNDDSHAIFAKQIDKDGNFNTKWVHAVNKSYLALFQVVREIYALNSEVHHLKWNRESLEEHKHFAIKEFFNCYKNSSIINASLTSTDAEIPMIQFPNYITNNYPDSHTVAHQLSDSTDKLAEKTPPNIILWIIIGLFAIILLTIVVFLCFRCCRKSNKANKDYVKNAKHLHKRKAKENVKLDKNNEKVIPKRHTTRN